MKSFFDIYQEEGHSGTEIEIGPNPRESTKKKPAKADEPTQEDVLPDDGQDDVEIPNEEE